MPDLSDNEDARTGYETKEEEDSGLWAVKRRREVNESESEKKNDMSQVVWVSFTPETLPDL